MANFSAIAFLGHNANGILSWLTDTLAIRAKLYDISLTVIDLGDEGWPAQLNECLSRDKPLFCFSFQGFGVNLSSDSGNIWTKLGVPFISLMGDAPFYSPGLHVAKGPGIFHMYVSEDFQSFYRDFMKGPNLSLVYKGFYPPNPLADQFSWQDRDLELVYVKTGVDPDTIRRHWAEFPRVLRAVIEDAASSALAGQKDTIGEIVAESFSANAIAFGESQTLLFRACSEVDRYVRAVRAERMLRAVMRHGGHIFGDWPHIDKANTHARFHGTLPAEKLGDLYARSRILVNVSPCTVKFVHERIVAAFLAKAFSISDATPFVTEALAAYPNFMPVAIDSADLAGELAAHLSDIHRLSLNPDGDFPRMLENSRRRAEDEFGIDRFMVALLDLVSLHRLEQASSFWSFPR